MILNHIQNFRAVAILFVVAYHSLGYLDWSQSEHTFIVMDDIFANSSVLFVFIAGYLFQYLSKNFNYRSYLIKKTSNVITPYVFFSLPAIFFSVFLRNPLERYPQLVGTSKSYQVLWFLAKGGAHINYPLWFIPMISIYYILSPLFEYVIEHPKLYYSIAMLFPLSLTMGRPDNIHVGMTALYYLPVYLMGMATCQFRNGIEAFLAKHLLVICSFFCLYLSVQAGVSEITGMHGNSHSAGMFIVSDGFLDLELLQKALLCYIILAIFKRFEKFTSPMLNYIADISFTIFFVHVYVLIALFQLIPHHVLVGTPAVWLGFFFLVCASCILFAWIGQKVLGKRSKMVIGAPPRASSPKGYREAGNAA